MPVLTVRLSEKEKAELKRRAKAAGVSTGGFVRRLLNDNNSIVTGADLLREMEKHFGDRRLKNRGRK